MSEEEEERYKCLVCGVPVRADWLTDYERLCVTHWADTFEYGNETRRIGDTDPDRRND